MAIIRTIILILSFCRVAKKARKTYYRDEVFLKKVGQEIREIRLKKGMTQMELAFACNDKDYSQINRIELGKVNFSVSYLSLNAAQLEVYPKDLIPVS
jgi:ribosome-binding protein aMBF1 (putative translation factor)